jgi:Ala-tRNA(Pro) deacylase
VRRAETRLDVFVAGIQEDTIAFNAGTHKEVARMRTADYRKLVRPLVVPLAREAAASHGW